MILSDAIVIFSIVSIKCTNPNHSSNRDYPDNSGLEGLETVRFIHFANTIIDVSDVKYFLQISDRLGWPINYVNESYLSTSSTDILRTAKQEESFNSCSQGPLFTHACLKYACNYLIWQYSLIYALWTDI